MYIYSSDAHFRKLWPRPTFHLGRRFTYAKNNNPRELQYYQTKRVKTQVNYASTQICTRTGRFTSCNGSWPRACEDGFMVSPCPVASQTIEAQTTGYVQD